MLQSCDVQCRAVPAGDAGCIEIALVFQEAITDDLWVHLHNGISAQEHEKVGRFAFPEDKRAFVAAHWLKRQMLSRAAPEVEPLSWQFSVGAYGKPQLAGLSNLHFNISHCRGLVACAVRRGGPVGIDVEFIGRGAPQEIASHHFSQAEMTWLQAQPEAEQTKAFFSIWTMKEAFVKATGNGLSQPLQDFSVCVDNLALLPPALPGGKLLPKGQSWHFYRAEPDHQHLLALAWGSDSHRAETVNIRVVQANAWFGSLQK